jgi:hypothetical protein
MFCDGLLSIGHFLLQIKQPEIKKHRRDFPGRVKACPGGGSSRLPDSQYDTASGA